MERNFKLNYLSILLSVLLVGSLIFYRTEYNKEVSATEHTWCRVVLGNLLSAPSFYNSSAWYGLSLDEYVEVHISAEEREEFKEAYTNIVFLSGTLMLTAKKLAEGYVVTEENIDLSVLGYPEDYPTGAMYPEEFYFQTLESLGTSGILAYHHKTFDKHPDPVIDNRRKELCRLWYASNH